MIIVDLLNAMSDTEDKRTKMLLATAIRRQVELEIEKCGGSSKDKLMVTLHEIGLVKNGKKLDAVKSYKDRTGLGLMESKIAVEAAFERHERATRDNTKQW